MGIDLYSMSRSLHAVCVLECPAWVSISQKVCVRVLALHFRIMFHTGYNNITVFSVHSKSLVNTKNLTRRVFFIGDN